MRDSEESQTIADAVERAEAGPPATPPLGELMADSQRRFDLHKAAERAAAAIEGAVPVEEPEGEAPETAEERSDEQCESRTDRVLQIALAVNVLVIAALLAFAGPAASPAPEEAAPTAADPFLQPPREVGQLPTHRLWQRAVESAGEGEFTHAVQLLQQYLHSTPSMHDVERQLVYNQMAYYLIKDGRFAEAQQYSLKAQQVLARAYLPEDLLRGAAAAEADGDPDSMRVAYARFLLQLEQASPTLQQREAEAFLKLGDSYRLSAQHAEQPR